MYFFLILLKEFSEKVILSLCIYQIYLIIFASTALFTNIYIIFLNFK
jgi:hypothetical protein